jgi:hypothetical protein
MYMCRKRWQRSMSTLTYQDICTKRFLILPQLKTKYVAEKHRLVLNSIIFWDMTPCSPLSFNRRFGGTYCLHLQGGRNRFSKTSKQTGGLPLLLGAVLCGPVHGCLYVLFIIEGVSIAQSVQPLPTGCVGQGIEVLFLAGTRGYSLHSIQISSGATDRPIEL